MASRYMNFTQLAKLGDNSFFRAPETYGQHGAFLHHSSDGSFVLAGLHFTAGKMNVTAHVRVRPGDTLGYNCGEVWRVKKPAEYDDPIRATLAEAHASQKTLRVGNPEELRAQYDPKATIEWTGSFNPTQPADEFALRSAGDAAVLCRWKWTFPHGNVREVVGVVIRHGCDRPAVAEWLAEQITPQGRERAANESRRYSVKKGHNYWSVRCPRQERDDYGASKRRNEAARGKRIEAIKDWLRTFIGFGEVRLSDGCRIEWCGFYGEYWFYTPDGNRDQRHMAAVFNGERLNQIAAAAGQQLPANLR